MARTGAEPPAAIPGAPPRPSQLSAALSVSDAAGGRAAADATQIARLPGRAKVKPNSLLAARAAEEYVYVGKDLRRIVIVGASLFGTLLGLWLLLVVLNLSGLY